MKKKVLYFFGWNAYGDYLSYNGMIRFLIKHFDEVHILCEEIRIFESYLNDLYADILNFVKFSSTKEMASYGENNPHYEFFSLHAYGPHPAVHQDFSMNKYVKKENYFDKNNNIVDFLGISKSYSHCSLDYIDNSSVFYTHSNLNPSIKIDYFHIERNHEEEEELYKRILFDHKISVGDEYDVICEYGQHTIRDQYKVRKFVNIHNLTDKPLRLLKLFENAKNIHLIENSHALFVYYSSMAGLVDFNSVYLHVYARNRGEFFYRMLTNPKIENWNIIYE